MKGGSTAIKSIHYEVLPGLRLSDPTQLQRVHQVIREELTPLQRQVILAYYFQDKNIPAIARERGVNKSTVCRTLHRAEQRIKRCLEY